MTTNKESNRLFVANIPYRATEQELRDLFDGFNVLEVKIMRDKENNSRGFGFVELATVDEARDAIEKLRDTEFDRRRLHLDFATERPARTPARPRAPFAGPHARASYPPPHDDERREHGRDRDRDRRSRREW